MCPGVIGTSQFGKDRPCPDQTTAKREPMASIEEAIAANTIDKLRPIAPQHCWGGRSGDWKSLMVPALAMQAFERHRSCFDAFQYDCHPDPDLDEATASQNWAQMRSTQAPAG